MKKFRGVFCVLLAIALSLTATLALADGAELTVTGDGKVLIEADTAIVSLGVREQSSDVRVAQSTVNDKIANIRQALIAAGLDNADINTDSINIYANYDYSEGMERIIGYSAYNALSINTKALDKVGAYIDAAFEAGANTLNSVSFTIEDDTEANNKALTLAVQDAYMKAEIIAAAAGKAIDSLESITENTGYSYDSGRNVYAMASEAKDMAAGTDIRAALLSVSASVNVVFELKD